jgi:hypothetical protein
MSEPQLPRRRRGILARLGERGAQFAYIGLWVGLFALAGLVSAGATFVPFFDRTHAVAPPADAPLPPPPARPVERGLGMAVKVIGEQVMPYVDGKFTPMFWAGVNLGSSVPGQEPGATAATRPDYDRWFAQMAELGVSVVRVYTILPPAFYDAIRQHNLTDPAHPLYVLQGIWIPAEDRFYKTGNIWDPQVVEAERAEIRDAVAAVHGDAVIDKVPGHASGVYTSDISPWLMGWAFGIEWDPTATYHSDRLNRGMAPYRGRYIRATLTASPTEDWIASNTDYIATLEAARGWSAPITFTNWITTDPLSHPAEPLDLEDKVSVDPMHLEATAAWPAGFFASYHVYPYYPDLLRWQPEYQKYRRPSDGKIDPYAGYLHQLREHHRGQAIMVTEFGQPTAAGCAHWAPLGRDQGCHSEKEAAANVIDMMRDIREEGYAGGMVFQFLDEWFKFTWNTIDYELPGHRRGMWRSVLTNEEHFGLIAMEPGPSDAVVLDGSDREWHPPTEIGRGSRSVRVVNATSDAENVYLRLRVAPELWRRKRIVIGLDARPGGNRGLPGAPGVDPDAEMAVVIEPGGAAHMLHAAWIEPLAFQYGINKGYIPANRADLQTGSGAWIRLRQILNRPYVLPLTGKTNPTELRDASLMQWGTTDPAAPGFDDRNMIDGAGPVLEVALPWSMMSFADPSTHRLYVPKMDGTIGTRRTTRIGIAIAVDGEPLLRTKGFTWDGWDTVQWHERRKAGWPMLRTMYRGYLGPLAPRP